ncbi:replication regulatory protein RepA [Klebsiella grimontii]|uniref:replication regulatory protein RepA n=1 Tax=Klebsiella grimontii TaxID=2058152 RepID=UPI002246255B|nr:replication regulatory protein RepA [Klebsiella grimontii]MCW9474427.1 replication regulatory protein RepA [Klebsiella grimontii]
MSQVVNAVTSSTKARRSYRKGSPMSAVERQQSHLARKKETHKEMRVYITSEIKDEFRMMCETKGVTQSEMIEKLIKEAVNQHECLVKD